MPVKKRAPKSKKLEYRERLFLILGRSGPGQPDPFSTRAEAVEVYRRHREELHRHRRPGHRPAAWWWERGDDAPAPLDQPRRLAELGELSADEVADFRQMAARQPSPVQELAAEVVAIIDAPPSG